MGNATKLRRAHIEAALAVMAPVFMILVSCSAAKPIATVPKGALSSQLNLGKSGNFSEQIATDDGDFVVTLGRNGINNVVASTKKGRAYVVDIEKSTVTKISPLYPNRDESVFSLTTSSKYVWEFSPTAGTVGRNKTAAGGGQVNLSKVSISDLVSDASDLVPAAATDTQLYLMAKDSLLVFTWADSSVGRKKIKLSRPFDSDETILGAGTMDESAPDASFWLATSRRLLTFRVSSWSEKSFTTNSDDSQVKLISLYYESAQAKVNSDPLIGLLDSGSIAALVLGAKDSKSEAESTSSESDE